MPWCEKCKMEYREGIEICADCGANLVNELPTEVVMTAIGAMESEETAQRLIDFLNYSKIETAVSELNEELNAWTVSVSHEDLKSAKKLFSAFYQVEKEKQANAPKKEIPVEEAFEEEIQTGTLESEESQVDEPDKLLEKTMKLRTAASTTYIKKEEQYNDLRFTAIIFLGFSFIGILFILFNVLRPMSFLGNPLSLIVLTGMIIGFIIVGISSLRKSSVIKNQIGEETNMTDEINRFLNANVTLENLMDYQDDTLSDEVNYINKTEYIKEMVMDEFGEIDDSYVDQIVEEFYNSTFEK